MTCVVWATCCYEDSTLQSALVKTWRRKGKVTEQAAQERLRSHKNGTRKEETHLTRRQDKSFQQRRLWHSGAGGHSVCPEKKISTFPGEEHNASVHGMRWNVASGVTTRRKHGVRPKTDEPTPRTTTVSPDGKCHRRGVDNLPD